MRLKHTVSENTGGLFHCWGTRMSIIPMAFWSVIIPVSDEFTTFQFPPCSKYQHDLAGAMTKAPWPSEKYAFWMVALIGTISLGDTD